MHRGGGSTAAAASLLPLLGISGGFGRRRNGNGGGSGSGSGCGGGRGGPSSSASSSGEFDPGPAGVTFGPEIRLRHSNVSACGSGETVAPARPGSNPPDEALFAEPGTCHITPGVQPLPLHVPNFYHRDSASRLGGELIRESNAPPTRVEGDGGGGGMWNWKVSTSRGLESSNVSTLGEHPPYNVAVAARDGGRMMGAGGDDGRMSSLLSLSSSSSMSPARYAPSCVVFGGGGGLFERRWRRRRNSGVLLLAERVRARQHVGDVSNSRTRWITSAPRSG